MFNIVLYLGFIIDCSFVVLLFLFYYAVLFSEYVVPWVR